MSNPANMTLVLNDDEFDTADAVETSSETEPLRPDRALLMDRTTRIRKALRSDVPQVIQIIAPTLGWARALSKEISVVNPR